MRLLHTGDWHLGRALHEHSLLEDQRVWLDRLLERVEAWRPDALIVAGDVYDRAVPSAEALALLGDTLERLVLRLRLPVILVAGNHDGPRRLDFGAPILAERGLHLFGALRRPVLPVVLRDDHGEVHVYPLPHFEPAEVPGTDPPDALGRQDGALARVVAEILERHPAHVRSVVVAHLFAAGGEIGESERSLSVGGSEAVSPARLAPFDYAALGHLHRPQAVGGFAHLRYAGSPLPYALAEYAHPKGVTWIEMDADGVCRTELREIPPRRRLRRLHGTLAGILDAAKADPDRDDYVFAELTDPGALFEPMARLREAYPNALHLRFEERAAGRAAGTIGGAPAAAGRSVVDLFADFAEQIDGRRLDDVDRALLAALVAARTAEERDR